jgi:hypothetical protein
MAALGDKLVLFDGDRDGTWTWDGTDWTQLSPAHSPGLRSGFAMASFGNTVVLFGGAFAPDDGGKSTYLTDTWTWNGSDWKVEAPTTTPPPRLGAALFGAGSVLALFGGENPSFVLLGDTWTWDGTNWTPLPTASAPSARTNSLVATLGGVGYLFSGSTNSATATWDTWILATAAPPGYAGGNSGELSIVTRCMAGAYAPVLGASVGANGQAESVGFTNFSTGANYVGVTAVDDTCAPTGNTSTSIRDMSAIGCNAAFSTNGTTALPFDVDTDMGPQPWPPGAWFAEFSPSGVVTSQLTDAGNAFCAQAVAVDTDGGIAFCLPQLTTAPFGWNVAPVLNNGCPYSGAFDSKHDLVLGAPGATPAGAIKLSGSDGGVVWGQFQPTSGNPIVMAIDANDDILLASGTFLQKVSGATGALLWQVAVPVNNAIATDAARNVYVAIRDSFSIIAKFSPSGALLSVATLPYGLVPDAIGVDPSGDLVFVAGDYCKRTSLTNPTGCNTLNSPQAALVARIRPY